MIKVNVEIQNKSWHKKIKNPKVYLNKRLKNISEFIKLFEKKNVTFTILLTNSIRMKQLNKKFRNKNKPTDVLSFPYFLPKNLKSIKTKNIYLGDIAASYQIINLRSKNSNFLLEFDKVWIHGLLHLVGYDHIKNKDHFKMRKVENNILGSIY